MDEDKDGIGELFEDRKLAFLLITAAAASVVVAAYHLISACRRGGGARARNPPPWGPPATSPGSTDRILAAEMIPSHKYRGGGDKDGEEEACAVCLGEFEEGEDLRALPECAHAFHAYCIDTWLFSHATCPVCRADTTPSPSPRIYPTTTGAATATAEEEVVVVVIDDRLPRR